MSKYQDPPRASSKDTKLVEEGDPAFVRLNMKLDRGMLPQGTLALSENKRLRKGTADTRPGIYPASWMQPPGGWTNSIMGSGLFSDPNKVELILMAQAGDNKVWAFRWDQAPFQIYLRDLTGAGEYIPTDRPVEFVQAFNKVLMMRSGLYSPMVWDGVHGHLFDPITKSDPLDTSTKLIPNMWTGEPYQNRILFPFNPLSDRMIMSDALDYSSYDHILSDFRINAGQADYIVRIIGWQTGNPGTALIFQSRSIHQISNFTIDPLQHKQEVLNRDVGAIAAKCFVQVGGDILFLSKPGGIYKMSQLVTTRAETTAIPVSDPIQPIIDRINWDIAYRSCAALLGEYAYFAVPIDGATSPNVLLVYNTSTSEWESVDRWKNHPFDQLFEINNMIVTDFNGNRRLFAIDHRRRDSYLMFEGFVDRLQGVNFWIKDVIETRGYGNSSGSGPGSIKNFKYAKAGFRTLHPLINITAMSDGLKESRLLTPNGIIKSPARWYVNNYPQGDEDPDFKREDYWNVSSPAGIGEYVTQSFDDLPPGPIHSLPFVAPQFDDPDLRNVKQDCLERKPLRMSCRWVSIRVENTQGQCDVLGVGVESLETQNVTRVAA